MREHPPLRELFELREGQITSLEKLQDIDNEFFDRTGKRMYFVDWFQFPGVDSFAMLVPPYQGLHFFKLDYSAAQAKSWKEHSFFYNIDGRAARDPMQPAKGQTSSQPKKPSDSPLDPALEPLRQIQPLIQPLIDYVNTGEMLVFCPTGKLHGIPLHAAIIDGENRSLIEECPIVYAASMTTFTHCVARESRKSRLGQTISRTYLAVYERTETSDVLPADSLRLRDDLYDQVDDLKYSWPKTTTLTGLDATRDSLLRAMQSDYVCFVRHAGGGHGATGEADSVLEKGLVPAPAEGGHQSMVTVADLFDADVKTSVLVLLTCQSVRERHDSGDERLGIATALLCAVANTVVGTMWKIPVETAMDAPSAAEGLLKDDQNLGNGAFFNFAVVTQRAVVHMKQTLSLGPFAWASLIVNGLWKLSA